jgi:type IV secretion system protein VirB10
MLPLPVMLGVAAALGAGLFLWMEGQRKVVPEPQAQAGLSAPPPPLVLPEEAKAPVPVITPSTAPRTVVKPRRRWSICRNLPIIRRRLWPNPRRFALRAIARSALVIDNTTGHGAEVHGGKGDGNEGGGNSPRNDHSGPVQHNPARNDYRGHLGNTAQFRPARIGPRHGGTGRARL